MSSKEKLITEQERHKAAFEKYYGLGLRRSYRKLAGQLGVSLSTVKLWARSFNWQSRIGERDAQAARKAADSALQTGVADIERNQKIVQMALVRLARAIADGRVKMQLSDLDRLLRLHTFLENQLDKQDPERPKTREEFMERYMQYFNVDELNRIIKLTQHCVDGTASAKEIDESSISHPPVDE